MKLRLIVPLLALAAIVLPQAIALPAAAPVAAVGLNFASPVLVVPAGTTVEWIGAALPHTVTTANTLDDALAGRANDLTNSDGNPDTFRSDLPMGTRTSHTFDTPGTYAYFCEIHVARGMVGQITVV